MEFWQPDQQPEYTLAPLPTCPNDQDHLYLRHTSASLLIQENEDSDVLRDLEDFFAAQALEDTTLYRHIAEGADDMPAHIKGALTQTHLAIPVYDGDLLLGRYQGIFLFEHRHKPRPREIVLHFEGQ